MEQDAESFLLMLEELMITGGVFLGLRLLSVPCNIENRYFNYDTYFKVFIVSLENYCSTLKVFYTSLPHFTMKFSFIFHASVLYQ